jgi:hypothetical protein
MERQANQELQVVRFRELTISIVKIQEFTDKSIEAKLQELLNLTNANR